MKPDDEICLCFHVSRRKVEQFIRVERPRRASELSRCYGAGTGCGWCRGYLKSMLYLAENDRVDLPDAETYAGGRSRYRDAKDRSDN